MLLLTDPLSLEKSDLNETPKDPGKRELGFIRAEIQSSVGGDEEVTSFKPSSVFFRL